MQVTYWPDVDILDIKLRRSKVWESDELCDGIIADYDRNGHIIGLEILDASKNITEPQNIVFKSMGRTVKGGKANTVNS